MSKRKETARERLRRLATRAEDTWFRPTHELDRDGVRMRLWFAYLDGYERRRKDEKEGRR